MTINIDRLNEKYPEHKKEIENIEKSYNDITNYFASIIAKGSITHKDMFLKSVINRTNQCIFVANFCLINNLQFPLLNIIRQMIEIYAVNKYVSVDLKNFDKAFLGDYSNENPLLKLPKIYNLIEKLKKKDPLIIEVYNEYSNLSHPNSRAVFSVFTGKEKYVYSMSSLTVNINSKDAFHIIRNIAGIANRIYLTSKEINPLDRYVTINHFK